MTEDAPPFSMYDAAGEKIVGSSTDLIEQALQAQQIAYTNTLLPWKRAYKLALNQSNTCVYATARTEQREPLFKWIGPLDHSYWALFALAGSKTLTHLEEAREKRIGGYFGDAETVYLIDNGYAVDEASDHNLNIRKLIAGRIDYWAVSPEGAENFSRRIGFANYGEVLRFHAVELYLACNKSVPDEAVAALNARIASLKAEKN